MSPLLDRPRSRDDFLLWNHHLPQQQQGGQGNHEFFYTNRLPAVRRLLQAWPRHTRAFRLLADAPTVTMQRLKALVAGSLPTFLDVRDNFGSPAITEDNWIRQLAGRRGAVLVGDDTWMDLFPPGSPGVIQAFPFPSFDVSDLDTVDWGVREHLGRLLGVDLVNHSEPQQLATTIPPEPAWDVLVGHMLGVDHAGHTFGPGHPEMARKLDELDLVVDRLAARLLGIPTDQERCVARFLVRVVLLF